MGAEKQQKKKRVSTTAGGQEIEIVVGFVFLEEKIKDQT